MLESVLANFSKSGKAFSRVVQIYVQNLHVDLFYIFPYFATKLSNLVNFVMFVSAESPVALTAIFKSPLR